MDKEYWTKDISKSLIKELKMTLPESRDCNEKNDTGPKICH